MKFLSVLFLATFASLLGAASSAQQATAPHEKKVNAGTNDRQRYQAKIEAKLRELDREITALKAKAAKQGKETGKEADQQLPELERKYEIARQKYEKFKESSQGAWQDMKAGIDAAIQDLQAAYDRAAERFK
jgi:predicted P-loop ATPase